MSILVPLSEMVEVVIGVDTHIDTHSAAVVHAGTGGVLAQLTVPATPEGYGELIELAQEHSQLRAWAIEGTGSHGAGLNRVLQRGAEVVIELDRPERAKRRNGAKSDPLDAIRAAREALSRQRLGTPRAGGDRAALAVLMSTRSSAVDAATIAGRQIFSHAICAPEILRTKLRGRKIDQMIDIAAKWRINPAWDQETRATAEAIRNLARRAKALYAEAADLHKQIEALVKKWRPDLLAELGVGPIVAATILCAWSHPGRIHSEAAFAKLAGVAPIPAGSGRTTNRHRLNRYGDRRLNWALHIITLTRTRCDDRTKAYIARRTTEGKTPREIRRCLKRFIARDLYRLLENPPRTTLDKT